MIPKKKGPLKATLWINWENGREKNGVRRASG